MKFEEEHFRENEIICPYCNHEFTCSYEYIGKLGDGETANIECGECEKTFEYAVHIDVAFSTSKLPCMNMESNHTWRQRKGYEMYPNARYCTTCGMDDWKGDRPDMHGRKPIYNKASGEVNRETP